MAAFAQTLCDTLGGVAGKNARLMADRFAKSVPESVDTDLVEFARLGHFVSPGALLVWVYYR